MSIRLYVGNLPKEQVNREELQAIFADEGDSITTKLIKDRKTGKCRGFAFVTVKNDELADSFIEKYNGFVFKDGALKIEKALPRTKNSAQGSEEGAENASDEDSTESQANVTEVVEKKASVPPPIKHNSSNNQSHNSGNSSGGERRRNKRNRRNQSEKPTVSLADSGDFQPDPRWAAALGELKERLNVVQVNS